VLAAVGNQGQDRNRAVLDRRGLKRPLAPGRRGLSGTLDVTPGASAALLLAEANAARSAAGKSPLGFLDPLLYSGVGAADYTGIVPQRYGSVAENLRRRAGRGERGGQVGRRPRACG